MPATAPKAGRASPVRPLPCRWPLLTWLRRRLPRLVPVVVGMALLNFLILQIAPGDIVDVLAGEAGAATPETMAALRARYGLDQPLWQQLLSYLRQIVMLDLGWSYRQNMPVAELIATRLPPTLVLMGTALSVAVTAGTVLGVLSARHVGRWPDQLISAGVLFIFAMPGFWIGLMALMLFSAKLGWLPSGGMVSVVDDPQGWRRLLDIGRHALLPALTLASGYLAVYAKLVRTAMLELHGAEFVRIARAKGASAWRVTVHHALRNALLPLVTMVGLQVASLLSGAVLVETVFAWPGLGRLAYEAVQARDLNLLLGILLASSVLVVLINLAVDALYTLLDPRVELTGATP